MNIDRKLLTASEYDSYVRLVNGAEKPPSEMGFLEQARTFKWTLVCLVVWIGVTIPCFAWAIRTDYAGNPSEEPTILMLALIAVSPLLFLLLYLEGKSFHRKRITGFLESIGYSERVSTGQIPSRSLLSDDNEGSERSYWATRTYDPARYYAETRGWSPEFRDYVRDAYGDLDTYESNHPD